MITCKNCGTESPDDSVFCQTCGKKLQEDNNSSGSGTKNPFPAEFSPKDSDISSKSRLIALLLAAFAGLMGIHHFYSGKISIGIALAFMTLLSLLTSWLGIGVLIIFIPVIWTFLDIFVILTGNYKDKEGKKIKNWLPEKVLNK